MSGLRRWLFEDYGRRPDEGRPALDIIDQNDSLYEEYGDFSSSEDGAIEDDYHRFILRKVVFIALFSVAAFLSAGLVITQGDYTIGFFEVYRIIWDHVAVGPPSMTDQIAYLEDHIVWNLRLPRVIVAIIAGFGLAVAGAVMQSTLKNPMADSYTTGVSAGAAFGATISMVVGIQLVSYDVGLVVNAFIFSLAPVAMIVLVSRRRNMSSTSMILAGLAVMYIFNACTSALKLAAEPDALAALYKWQVGSLSNMLWSDVPIMLAVTVLGSILIMLLSNRINVLSSGDDSANSLGIDAKKLRIVCLVIVSLITASIVAFTGTIGFIGLVAPHVARIFIGSDNRYLIPASAAFGALLLLVSDYIGRTVISPSVLEVGVVTAFIGGPMFLYLIMRQRKEVWT